MKYLLINALFAIAFVPLASQAQGPLAPPLGPPAPSMKTLGQIEPRIDVTTLAASPPYTIGQSGSYYLTKNITVAAGDAILIQSDGVSLDLNGFSLLSSNEGTTGSGIRIAGNFSRIHVFNGSIAPASGSTYGFLNGIYTDSGISQALLTDLVITGAPGQGIYTSIQGIVKNCAVYHCGNAIRADQVSNSTAYYCSGFGILGKQIDNCIAVVNYPSTSTAIIGEIVSNCSGAAYYGDGINGNTIINCTGSTSGGYGLVASLVTNSTGSSGSGTGISCTSAGNSIGSSSSGIGLSAVIARGCSGSSAGNVATSIGLSVTGTAESCRGTGGGGTSKALKAAIAIGCTYLNGALDVPAGKQFNM